MTTPKTTTQLDDARLDAHGEPFFVGGAYRPEDAEAHARLMERLRTMTREEFLASLVAAGIYAPDGTLQPPYASDEAAPGARPPSRGRSASR